MTVLSGGAHDDRQANVNDWITMTKNESEFNGCLNGIPSRRLFLYTFLIPKAFLFLSVRRLGLRRIMRPEFSRQRVPVEEMRSSGGYTAGTSRIFFQTHREEKLLCDAVA